MAKPAGITSLARSKKINMLIYAEPGVGKTTLVGTTPGKTLILRPPVDHTDSIKSPPAGMEEWVLSDWNEAFEAMDYLRSDGDKYDWIWLDSISLFQDIGLDDLWDTVVREKPQRARYGLDKQEYGINMFRLGNWIRHIVGASMFNFGMTAHVAELMPSLDPEKDEKLMPFIHGKNMAPKMCGYMNVVAYLDVNKKGARVLYTQATDRYYAKDQFDAFPGGKLANPSMTKIIDLIAKQRPAEKRTPKRRTASTTRRTATKKGKK